MCLPFSEVCRSLKLYPASVVCYEWLFMQVLVLISLGATFQKLFVNTSDLQDIPPKHSVVNCNTNNVVKLQLCVLH